MGWAFSPVDFRDLGRVDMPLQRLLQARRIRRVLRNICDYPGFSELLQEELSPDIHQVALALQRKFGWQIQPDSTFGARRTGMLDQTRLDLRIPGLKIKRAAIFGRSFFEPL